MLPRFGEPKSEFRNLKIRIHFNKKINLLPYLDGFNLLPLCYSLLFSPHLGESQLKINQSQAVEL